MRNPFLYVFRLILIVTVEKFSVLMKIHAFDFITHYSPMYHCVNSVTDIHPETANGKKEFWSSLAPLPLEVVLSAGQRAKEQPSSKSQNGFSGNGKFICS
jgi:hypothetical protein